MPDYNSPLAALGNYQNTPVPSFGGYSSVSPSGRTRGNLNPFYRGAVDPETAFEVRKKAKRVYAPSMAALVAQNALLEPTLALQGRAAQGYADLFGQVAPEYVSGFAAADPETSGLLHLLNVDASSLVGRGSMDPYEDRLLQENIRGAQASRGLAYSPAGALEELINLDRARDTRRIQRGQYGAGIFEAGRSYYSPVLMALLNRYQSPVSGTSTDDLLSVGLNDTIARRNAHAARIAGNQALWGSAIEAAGAATGGALSAAGGGALGCWVAEVLYGVDDPRTHLARAWVRAHPERSFVRLYQRHGKAWARWLEAHPWVKPLVQPIWDRMWENAIREGIVAVKALPILLGILMDRNSQRRTSNVELST